MAGHVERKIRVDLSHIIGIMICSQKGLHLAFIKHFCDIFIATHGFDGIRRESLSLCIEIA